MIILGLFLPALSGQHKSFRHDSLKQQWASPADFRVPESVCWDSKNEVIYVANINGKPLEKNNKGFISKLSITGEIISLKWIEGLHAPKGMGIHKGFLFVSDIDHVAKIHIAANRLVKKFPAEGAVFLNDITVDHLGRVYISDKSTNRIYRLTGDKMEKWLDSPTLNSPNGLYAEKNRLLVGTKEAVSAIDYEDKNITTFIKKTGAIDGLVPDGKGNYIISDWSGRIHLIHPNKEKILLLDTTPDKINAADIDYIPGKKLLLVPTFFDNRVTAHTLQ